MARENQVGDYLFTNKVDAQQALKEQEKINKIKEKLNNGYDVHLLYNVYNKCIETRTFRTPIGYDFLKDMRRALTDSDGVDSDILPIPMYTTFEHSADNAMERTMKFREETRQSQYKKKKDLNEAKFKWSLFVNVVLLIVVGIMFYITTTGSNPNILNYENAIINKYSDWSDELTERENLIREKEAQLNISFDD